MSKSVLIGVGGDFYRIPMEVLQQHKMDEKALAELRAEQGELRDDQLEGVSGGAGTVARPQLSRTKLSPLDLVAGVRG